MTTRTVFCSLLIHNIELFGTEMGSVGNFGTIFNCGFCHTFVYEYSSATNEGKGKRKKKTKPAEEGGLCTAVQVDAPCPPRSDAPAEQIIDKVRICLSESFKSRFDGPQFSAGDNYFETLDQRSSKFERHAKLLMAKAWCKVFNPHSKSDLKVRYLSTFSSSKWDNLSQTEKAQHSLSNCKACAKYYPNQQESFPLKPIFRVEENDCASLVTIVEKEFKSFDATCRKIAGQKNIDSTRCFNG